MLKIPLAELAAGDPLPQRWRANFFRVDRGSPDAFSAWSPTFADPADFHAAARFGDPGAARRLAVRPRVLLESDPDPCQPLLGAFPRAPLLELEEATSSFGWRRSAAR